MKKTVSTAIIISVSITCLKARELSPVPSDTVTLQEVVVTAKECEGIASSSRIGRAAMEHLQPTSFSDLLELLPGNISKNPMMGQVNTISLRETGNLGATGAHVSNPDYDISSLGTMFIVDGSPINQDAELQSVGTYSDPASPGFLRNTLNKGIDMRSISTDDIESVEIVRGIPSAEFGNLTSGLVNIRRIRRQTPISVRFKADEWSKLLHVGKGFQIGANENIINFDVGYLDSKTDPRNNLENYRRLTGSARYTSEVMKEWGTARFNTSADFTGSFDSAKTDPDLSDGRIDEYKNIFRRFSLSGESVISFYDFPWLSSIEANAALSIQDDILMRRRQTAPSRPSAAPTTMLPGINEGHFIIGEYIADYRSEGKPLTAFLKVMGSGSVTSGGRKYALKAGLEWNISKNLGHGQIYDLMRPLSASWTSRPRDFSEIPALNTLAFFIQNITEIKTRAGDFDFEAGIRGTSIPGLDSRYYIANRIWIDPRVNFLWYMPPAAKATPFVGGGFGLTTKMPTVDYLFPQPHYTDLVEMNYYDSANPDAHSRLLLKTYIHDAANYDLRPARNLKWEIRIGLETGGNRISITYFNERLNSGFRYSSVYTPVEYRQYDTSSLSSSAIQAPPASEGLPYYDRTVLDGFRMATNGTRIDKQGIEFQINTVRWKPLRTSLIVTGAWFRSRYSNSGLVFSAVGDVIVHTAVSDRYVGLYDSDEGRINEQFNTNFMFDTQLKNLGLIFTTSLQCMWYVKSRLLPQNGIPAFYIDAADGMLHEFTEQSAEDPLLYALIKTYNANRFDTVEIAPALYLNFKASKTIGKWMRISLFVNRIIDWLPDYRLNGLTIRRRSDAYFGMEINFKI